MTSNTEEKRVNCLGCGMDCPRHHWMCDQQDGAWCPPCFADTACGQDAHGEDCPTQVFEV